jgi:flagellar FliL protein
MAPNCLFLKDFPSGGRLLTSLLRLLAVFGFLLGPIASAEEAPVAAEREVRYVQLQPAFVTNYGFTENGRLKYVKTDISVRVSTQQAEMAARYHLPALPNALILLLSAQDELNSILEREEGEAMIDDLMFTNFMVQR